MSKELLTGWIRLLCTQAVNPALGERTDVVGIESNRIESKVLRTLCLELDETSLLLQMSAFRKDPVEAARALGCEGRG